MKRPNILLIMTDQQRRDTLGCYGSSFAQCPNIDALAADGVTFENCYVQNPFCCPSRHSILTGRYPHCHGVRANWYPRRKDETSFGHQLSRAGYRSAIVGKMHLTPWQDNFGFDGRIIADGKGFPYEDDYGRCLASHGLSREQMYDKSDAVFHRTWGCQTWQHDPGLHIDSFIGRASADYLCRTAEDDAEQPWCLIASFCGPHNPFDPPAPYDKLYKGVNFPGRNMTLGEVERKPREAFDYIAKVADNLGATRPDQLSDGDLQMIKEAYYGNMTQIDHWVGRLVQTLKDTGQYEDTVIVFMSDHGEMLGDHGLIFKQCFYEDSVAIPFIVHYPKRFAAGRSSALVESIDVCNTVCDLGRVWPGVGRQGKSLVPLLETDDAQRHFHREAAFAENYFGRMVRHENHKLVYYPGKPYGELYDLDADPAEQDNLWDKAEGSETKQRLKDMLLEWSFASEDPLPLPFRRGHVTDTDPLLEMAEGKAVPQPRQPWHLDHMLDFYEDCVPNEPGRLR